MNKYIQDFIRNNLRFIIKDLTVPQQKAISELVRGLFTAGKPILSKLAQDKNKTAKKQSEKYSKHLGNVQLQKAVNDFALKQAKKNLKNKTIIAYDITDISKSSAKKMENLQKIYDGSSGKGSIGYELHGVGINGILVRLENHEGDTKTKNQTRKAIVEEIAQQIGKKGIWVFDRGNDDKQFFKYLRQDLKVDFIVRLKSNRQVVIRETGVKIKVENMKEGIYEVYLMTEHNDRIDTQSTYTLVIKNHLPNKDPIRLITSLSLEKYSGNQLITMYLQRWGIENIFKRIKSKFELEKIRVMTYQRLLNLISLIQFATVVSVQIYMSVQLAITSLTACVLSLYKKFLKLQSLTINVDSFISYMQTSLEPLIFRSKLSQQSLFSNRQLKKLGII